VSDAKIVNLVDESNKRSSQLPLVSGTLGPDCIDIATLYKDTGHFTYDPGYGSTASTKSAITYIDGDAGILRSSSWPRSPPSWKRPTCCSTANCRTRSSSPPSSTTSRITR
jgi:hypothetical protein